VWHHCKDRILVPAIDPFVQESRRPIGWPQSGTFTVTGGALGRGLVYGTLS
jgi:hypothetical protein